MRIEGKNYRTIWFENNEVKIIDQTKLPHEFKIKSLAEPLKNPCYIPSYTFFLDYNGDVLMCPHDWGKKNILGNLNSSSFKEIWLFSGKK